MGRCSFHGRVRVGTKYKWLQQDHSAEAALNAYLNPVPGEIDF